MKESCYWDQSLFTWILRTWKMCVVRIIIVSNKKFALKTKIDSVDLQFVSYIKKTLAYLKQLDQLNKHLNFKLLIGCLSANGDLQRKCYSCWKYVLNIS